MSFCNGFDKTASPAKLVGQAAGYTVRGAAATTKAGKQVAKQMTDATKNIAHKESKQFVEGYKKARGPVGPTDKPKKSWAAKHPWWTAGLLYLGTKAALSGTADKNPQQPQYVPPQQ